MSDRTVVYVDGESHYIRSETAWRQIHGNQACLERLRYASQADEFLVLVLPAAKVFWTRWMNPDAYRATYFSSAACDDRALHEMRVSLRAFGLEPSIVQERKDLMRQRLNRLTNDQIIEKPKGVDIALAVRMIEDAHRAVFEACHLYTSDVDFLPAIQAVQALGKRVFVHGYRNGLSDRSPLLHAPDQFIDLELILRTTCVLAQADAP